jgi:hypothetical protein
MESKKAVCASSSSSSSIAYSGTGSVQDIFDGVITPSKVQFVVKPLHSPDDTDTKLEKWLVSLDDAWEPSPEYAELLEQKDSSGDNACTMHAYSDTEPEQPLMLKVADDYQGRDVKNAELMQMQQGGNEVEVSEETDFPRKSNPTKVAGCTGHSYHTTEHRMARAWKLSRVWSSSSARVQRLAVLVLSLYCIVVVLVLVALARTSGIFN